MPATVKDKPGKGSRFPPWIRVKVHAGGDREGLAGMLEDLRLNTVCQSAKCPNLGECWRQRSATFMILGDRCTRDCAFCAVTPGSPAPLDPDEPARVAAAAARLGLRYVVLTSVQRDDLPDKGADHFAATVAAIRQQLPDAGIEVLTPDFQGQRPLVETVLAAEPTVFNHNLETCARLSPQIRGGGSYERSLGVLALAAELAGDGTAIKSGIMVGLGETDLEVEETLRDMHAHGVRIVTIGQYLPPSPEHLPLARYVEPETFSAWAELAGSMGFDAVASDPMVRSSYRAEELARRAVRAKGRKA